MQFTTAILASLLLLTTLAAPAPAPQTDISITLDDIDISDLAAQAKADIAANPSQNRIDLSAEQCSAACKGGVAVAKAFCGKIPNPFAKVACKVAAALANTSKGQEICVDFCDKTF